MTLSLKGVSFSYGEKAVLHEFNLVLNQGERIALMAPSGAGKTTVLRLMAGLCRPDRGKVEGIPQGAVGMLFQEDRLIPSLTALDNLAFAAAERSRAELMELLSQLGLEDEAGSLPDSLSGGMKRRVAIARALAVKSPLLLLDEPFAGLDASAREAAAKVILNHSRDCIMVAVTHDPAEAKLLDARIFMLPQIR